MYAWIWHHLPGPLFVRLVLALLLIALAVAVCFEFIFPAIAPHMPFNQTTVDANT